MASNEIVKIINSHHTIPENTTGHKYEARVFYTDMPGNFKMINYFRIKDPCNFDYFKSDLGWEQKNGTGNYVPVKYNCENDSTNDDFICRNGDKPILDNDAIKPNELTIEKYGDFTKNKLNSATSENIDLRDNNVKEFLTNYGLISKNDNISPKKFFSVVTPKNGANNLTTICGFHTADVAKDLKIQFFDTTDGNYILKYDSDYLQIRDYDDNSTGNMRLILCQIPNNQGGGKRKKKTPSARSKKRSKTSQTKTLKKH